MRKITQIILLFLVIFGLLAAPSAALAQTSGGDDDGKVVFGGSYRLKSGDTLDGSLAVFGGEATLEENSTVNGDIALSGGTITINGVVNGDIVVLGGTITLTKTAVVHGDISTVGGSVNRDPNAQVDGDILSGPHNFSFPLPRRFPIPNMNMNLNFDPLGRFIWAVFQAVVMAGLAALIVLVAPTSTQRVASTIMSQPVIASGIGLLSAILAPALLVMLAITILLIPISLLGFLLIIVAIAFGWIALGLEIGSRIAASSHQSWSPPLAAGIGTLILAMIANVIGLIDCIGWTVPFLISVVGLGGVIASRFGRQIYAPAASTTVLPSAITPGAPQAYDAPPAEWQPPAGQPPSAQPPAPHSGKDTENFPPTDGA